MKKMTGILLILLMFATLTGFKSESGLIDGILSVFSGDSSGKTAELVTGTDFNGTIHELAGDDYNFKYYYHFGYDPKLEPSNIKRLKRAETMDSTQKETAKKVSTDASEYPVYVWYDQGTIYYYSKAGTIQLNENAKGMFYHLSVKNLNVSDFDTGKVKDLFGIFLDCRKLKSVDVSGWDTSQVTDMSRLFNYCRKLEKLDLSSWDTSQVKDMESMFGGCRSLVTVKLAGWNTSIVEDFMHMFYGCSSLTSPDFSKWNTGSVVEMTGMFAKCSLLSSQSVHSCDNWDYSKVSRSGFFQTFSGVESGHPEWKGTWDEKGTFTPADPEPVEAEQEAA